MNLSIIEISVWSFELSTIGKMVNVHFELKMRRVRIKTLQTVSLNFCDILL